MEPSRVQSGPPPARLGLVDATSMVLGIIIGVGIFQTPGEIFSKVPGPWEALGVWALGGVLALIGALCFAELASTYPRSGGEYVYLTRAYGSGVGFLYAWAQLSVIRPGSIGALAYVFADYAAQLWNLQGSAVVLLALGAVLVLTLVNILGVTLGTGIQNLLTLAKILGLGLIIVSGFFLAQPAEHNLPIMESAGKGWFASVMILVLWTYAGWHEAAYVASEVQNNRRNLPLALILGALAVTTIYLLVNGAVLWGLGFERANQATFAKDLMGLVWGQSGFIVLTVLVMVSALGALNGTIFTTARIYAEFGADHRLFSSLAHWSRSLQTPARAFVLQGVISLGLILGIGLTGESQTSFDRLVTFTAATFWFFFCLTGVALFVLRRLDRGIDRPFRVPLYPVLPLIFCGWCGYMVYGAISYSPGDSLVGLLILLAGWPFFYIPKKIKKRSGQPTPLEPSSLQPAARP